MNTQNNDRTDEDRGDEVAGEVLALVAEVRKGIAKAAGVPALAVWPEAVRAGLLSRGSELSDDGKAHLAHLIGRGVFDRPRS